MMNKTVLFYLISSVFPSSERVNLVSDEPEDFRFRANYIVQYNTYNTYSTVNQKDLPSFYYTSLERRDVACIKSHSRISFDEKTSSSHATVPKRTNVHCTVQ